MSFRSKLLYFFVPNLYIFSMRKNNRRFFVILIAAVLCCAGYFAWDYFGNKEEKVSYVDFWQCVEAGDLGLKLNS